MAQELKQHSVSWGKEVAMHKVKGTIDIKRMERY